MLTMRLMKYSEALVEAITLGLELRLTLVFKITLEIMDVWLWLQDGTKPYREQLKEAGFRWASKIKLVMLYQHFISPPQDTQLPIHFLKIIQTD